MSINPGGTILMEMKKEFLALTILILFTVAMPGCKEDEEPPLDCTQLSLTIVTQSGVSSCGQDDASFQATASGGVEPYTYDLNGLINTTGLFTGLKAGSYKVNVTGGNGDCTKSADVILATTGSDFTAAAVPTGSTVCPPNSNGFITVDVSGGVSPYQFRLNNNTFAPSNVIPELGKGIYSVEAKDANGCTVFMKVEVPGMQYQTIKSLIELNCATANCHDGSLGAQSDYTLFENVKENSNAIRTLTSNKSMPPNGNLSQEQIDLIACWVADGANR